VRDVLLTPPRLASLEGHAPGGWQSDCHRSRDAVSVAVRPARPVTLELLHQRDWPDLDPPEDLPPNVIPFRRRHGWRPRKLKTLSEQRVISPDETRREMRSWQRARRPGGRGMGHNAVRAFQP
jgi:hypothetical protein